MASAVVGLVGTVASGIMASNRADRDRRSANSAADRASQLAQYTPERGDFEDSNYGERKGHIDDLRDRTGAAGFRSGQEDLMGRLEGRLDSGESIAATQLQAGQDTAANQALALAQQQGGGALGLRSAIGAGNQGALQVNQQAGIARMQEEQQNIGALGQLYNQGRAGDLGQNAALLQIAQQQSTEDERNRQALIERQKIIAAGKHVAAGGQSSFANQQAKNASSSGDRSSNLLNNFLSKGLAPALEQGYDYFNKSTPGVVNNSGYTPSAPGTGSTAADRRG